MILSPAAPSTAPRLGDSLSDPLQMYLGDIYTVSVNLAGLPGITVPCGMDDKGLPIGMQLIETVVSQRKTVRAAYTYEQARGAFGQPENGKEEAKQCQNSMKPSSDLKYMWSHDENKNFCGCSTASAVRRTPTPARSAPVCRDPFRY